MLTADPLPGSLADQTLFEKILSRPVTIDQAWQSPCMEDDLRMFREVKPTFLGRAAYAWQVEADDDAHFAAATRLAESVHKNCDDQMVLQACIFEAIYPEADNIPIPAWVFEAFDEPVEQRNFSWQAMIGKVMPPGQGTGGIWHRGGVPDLTTDEAMRWFYYRAVNYLKAGYEALHLGQVHLVAAYDQGFNRFAKLCDMIREAATTHARRGWVILDAHSHGIARQGRLLLDFASRPISARCLTDHPPQLALIKRGNAVAGLHPGGWWCDESPVVMEIDNWLGYSLEPNGKAWFDYAKRAHAGRWGYDDISWFARLPKPFRADFLRYASNWTRLQGKAWHFQPVLARTLGRACIEKPDGQSILYYRANQSSQACPDGFSDEQVVAEILSESIADDFPNDDSGETAKTNHGLTVPEPVSIQGSFQPLVGGIAGDASCPWSKLYRQAPGQYERVFAAPFPGCFSLFVCCGGTQTEQIHAQGLPHSNPLWLVIHKAGQLVRITLNYDQRNVAARDAVTGEDLISSDFVEGMERQRVVALHDLPSMSF